MPEPRRALPRSAAVLGGGCLGTVLAAALPAAGIPLAVAWDRSPRAAPFRATLDRLAKAELIFLAVSDPAVALLCRRIAPLLGPSHLVVHCAGALGLEPLAPARARGARVGSLHPLRAVPRGSDASILAGAAAGVAGESPRTRTRLFEVARALGMTPIAVTGARPLYHAGAVLAAGATVALFSRAVEAFRRATGATERAARAALLPLARGALAALETRTPRDALTGPVPRGDAATVARHRRALPVHLVPLYDELTRAALSLAPSAAIEAVLRTRSPAAPPERGRASRSSSPRRPAPSPARPSASSRSPTRRGRPRARRRRARAPRPSR
jgi:predicted short-subunit dehydrogenase-like oxidoreductase (DUF2520 family)